MSTSHALVVQDSAPFKRGQALTLLERNATSLNVVDLSTSTRGSLLPSAARVVNAGQMESAVALHDFEPSVAMATDPDLNRFVPLRKSATVFVFSRSNDLWWAAICDGRFGLAPSEYIRLNSAVIDAPMQPALPPPLPDRSASSAALNASGVAPPLPPTDSDYEASSSPDVSPANSGLLPKSRPATLAARFTNRRRSMSKPELVNPEMLAAAVAAAAAVNSGALPQRSAPVPDDDSDDDEAPPLPRTKRLDDLNRVPPPPPSTAAPDAPPPHRSLATTLNVPPSAAASAAAKNKHLVVVRGRSNSSLPRPNAATVAAAKGATAATKGGGGSSKPPPPPPAEPPTPAPPEHQMRPPAPPATPAPPAMTTLSLEQRETNVRAREVRVMQREAELDALAAKLAARQRELDEFEAKMRGSLERTKAPSVQAPSPPVEAPPPLPPQLELPEGWGEARDADGEIIYFDIFTRHEQREKPNEPSLGWRRMVYSRQKAAVVRLRESVAITDPQQIEMLKKLQERVDSQEALAPAQPEAPRSSKVNAEQRIRQVREFFDTESTFNSGLESAISYRDALFARIVGGQLPDLSRDELRAIFPESLGLVLALSTELVSALAAVHAAPTNVSLDDRVGSVMCRYAPRLSVLADYIVAYQRSSDVLKEVSKRPAVAAALAEVRAQCSTAKHSTLRVGGKLTLPDLLIMPVQRCPRYEMLISALLSNTNDADPERPNLVKALSLVHAANEHNNNMLAQAHNEAVIRSIASEIHNCPPLLIPGRQYLLRSALVRSSPPHRSKDRVNRTYILFSDMLIEAESLSKPIGGAKLALSATLQINAQTSVRAVQAGVVSDSERANAFFLRHGPKGQLEDIFIAPSAAVANAWRTAVESLELV
jgi:hypothetical protein